MLLLLLSGKRVIAGDYNGRMAERVVVIDLEIMNGAPCFRGTRVPFQNLIDYIEGGHSIGEFLDRFSTVSREMAVQALEEAKQFLFARIAEVCWWTSTCRSDLLCWRHLLFLSTF